ncbi:MAG: metallophosphoesterase [Acidobacteria bacterium]|nr:metallophosphoesterase [Acidobacteriota bacterium]
MTRRLFGLHLCVLAPALLIQAGAAEPSLEFVQLTDTHVNRLAGAEARVAKARSHFAPSLTTLPAFFAGPGRELRPSFYLITGDLIDAFRYEGEQGAPLYGQVEAFAQAAAGAGAPLYLALGNHDLQHYSADPATGRLRADQSVAGEARAAWIRSAPCFAGGTYYAFDRSVGRRTYRFVVLDNGYNSGAIAAEELQWLRREAGQQGGRTLLLAMHIPLADDPNSAAIKDALAAAKIALVLAGHKHTNGVEEIPLGAATAVQVRTAAFGYGEKNWRRVRLRQDAIDVFSTGSADAVERTISIGLAAAAAGR